MRTGLLRWADAVPAPWKNGGGVTTELLGSPEGAGLGTFDWRISVAEVAVDGPFSSFDGVDRVIVLVAGVGMELTIDGEVRSLIPLEPFTFAGESGLCPAWRTDPRPEHHDPPWAVRLQCRRATRFHS